MLALPVLASATGGGNGALFISVVFLHVISALAGFGSIGFAGTYASRAAHLAPSVVGGTSATGARPPVGGSGVTGPGTAPEALATPSEAAAAGTDEKPVLAKQGPPADERGLPRYDAEVEELMRYFERPARFWKAMLLVPAFGLIALGVEPGGKGWDQVWALAALLVWLSAILITAAVIAPALGQMRTILFEGGTDAPGTAVQQSRQARLVRAGTLASRGAVVCDLLFFVALALMIWRP